MSKTTMRRFLVYAGTGIERRLIGEGVVFSRGVALRADPWSAPLPWTVANLEAAHDMRNWERLCTDGEEFKFEYIDQVCEYCDGEGSHDSGATGLQGEEIRVKCNACGATP